jgi:uncharacterized protein (TIGR03086 family)
VPAIDLRPAAGRLGALIEAVREADLDRPTPCSEYCVGDLLDHVQGLTIAFGGAAVKADGPSSTMGPAGTAANLDADWRQSLPARLMNLAGAWQDPEAWAGMTRVGGLDLPGEVAGIVAFGELSVHGWDLAQATQLPFEPDPDGVGPLFELIQQTFGSGQDAPRGPAFGPAVPVPGDAPVFHRILGLLGRDPRWPGE